MADALSSPLIQLVGSILLAAPGWIVAFIAARNQAKKNKKEAEAEEERLSDMINETARKWLAEYEKRMEESERRIEKQAATIAEQQAELNRQTKVIAGQQEQISMLAVKLDQFCIGARLLHGQVERLGGVPIWTPPANGG